VHVARLSTVFVVLCVARYILEKNEGECGTRKHRFCDLVRVARYLLGKMRVSVARVSTVFVILCVWQATYFKK